MKAHLFIFDSSTFTQKEMAAKLDSIDKIENWLSFMDNAFCLVSDETSKSLSRLVRQKFPDLRFIITEIETQKKGGYLPKSVWEFINNPEPIYV